MNIDALERHLLDVAAQVPCGIKTAAASEEYLFAARKMLCDPQTTATGCFYAADRLLGNGFRAWEPESLWLSLSRQDVDVPLVNRDKLLAALTLSMLPAFWWEVNAFENTTMAFNNVVSDHRVLQEATPAQLCWAVYEAELLYAEMSESLSGSDDASPAFDREPIGYTAVVLHRAGYLLTPDILSFAQKQLDILNQNGNGLGASQVRAAWAKLRKQNLSKKEFGESALDLQLARLAATQLYVTEQAFQYEDDRKRLGLM